MTGLALPSVSQALLDLVLTCWSFGILAILSMCAKRFKLYTRTWRICVGSYGYLRGLVSKLVGHGSDGWTRATVLFLALMVSALLANVVYASYRNPGTSKIVELHNVKVLRDIGRYDYWFQTEQGVKFYATFCADYEPQFSGGQTLLVLKFEDRGACWSVANTHPAYLILRDEKGVPIVGR